MEPDVNSANAYQILGVNPDADLPTIRRAFKKLAMKHHPDAVPPEERSDAAKVFSRINQAHEVLKDKEKRAQYDGLLRRGVTPDLSTDMGADAQFRGLADIIGEIQSLRLGGGAKITPSGMDDTLCNKMLLPSLIKGDGFEETIVDIFHFSSLDEHKGFELPQGTLTEHWCVVTELRVFFLMSWVHEYQKGNTKYTQTYFRSRAFPYLSLKNFELHELGRTFVSYKLELEDEDKTRFVVSLPEISFTRLMLVANAYQLPLKIKTQAAVADEIVGAVTMSLIPGFLWASPFAIYGVCKLIGVICSNDSRNNDFEFGAIFDWMTDHYLTAIAMLSAPGLTTLFLVQVYCSWYAGHPRDVVGVLPRDYARGADPAAEKTNSAPVVGPPAGTGPEAPPPIPQFPTAIPVAVPHATRPLPPNEPRNVVVPPSVSHSSPKSREASDAGRIVVCVNCKQKYMVPESRVAPVKCKKCGVLTPVIPPPQVARPTEKAGPVIVAMPESLRFAREQAALPPEVTPISPIAPPTNTTTEPTTNAAATPRGAVVVVQCPSCKMEYRMPAGRQGTAQCTSCGNPFRIGESA